MHLFPHHSEDYKIIAKSKLFNKRWYLKTYPDVKTTKANPIKHYMNYGWKEGRNPSKYFNTNEYLNFNADVKQAGINPLLHYLKYGCHELGRTPYFPSNKYTRRFKRYSERLKHDTKNILLITHSFNITGAPLAVFNTAKYLKSCGYHVTVIGGDNDELVKQYQAENIDCFTNFHWTNDDIEAGINNFDFVFCNTVLTYPFIQSIKRVPHMWRIAEGQNVHETFGHKTGLLETLSNDSNVYAVSKYTQRCIANLNKHTKLLLYGVKDLSNEYVPTYSNDSKVRFCVIGNFCARKAQNLIIKAFQELPNEYQNKIEIHFIGATSKNIIKNDNLFYHGVLQGKEKYDVLNSCDILLCPSLDDPNPQVVMEGMMMRKACIVSDCCGQADYITNNKDGFIVKAGNLASLKKCFSNIIEKKYDLAKMGNLSYKLYKQYFTEDAYFKHVQSVIEKSTTNNINDDFPKNKKDIKLLVHLHLYYQNQLDWFLKKLKNITVNYDLYVTVVDKNENIVQKIKQFKNDAHIMQVGNMGYDVYPFYQVLQNVNLDDYDCVLKIHTKADRDTQPWKFNNILYHGPDWRNALVLPLIGNKILFNRALRKFKQPKVGMVGCANLLKNFENKLQIHNTEKLCKKMGIEYCTADFIAGTMFMIRAQLLKPFQKTKFETIEFVSENQTGDTCSLAHSCEIMFGILVHDCGYKTVGVHTVGTLYKKLKARLDKRRDNKRANPLKVIKHSKYFDKKWYLNQNPDVKKANVNPTEHYLKYGWKEGRNPSPKFDSFMYLLLNKDVKNGKVCPLLHYELYGKREGRAISFDNDITKENAFSAKKIQEYKKKIDACKIVSFDIFDTLLCRPYVKPTDLFVHMEKIFNKPDFANARINAEKTAFAMPFDGDVTLDMIYKFMPKKFLSMRDKEMDFEYTRSIQHPIIKELYDYAVDSGKTIIAVSDMYLPKSLLVKMLHKNKYNKFHEVFISNECGASKRDGTLYDYIIKYMKCNPQDIIHIGDNQTKDGDQADKKHLNSLVIPKIIDNLFNTDIRTKMLYDYKKDNLETSIFLSILALHTIKTNNITETDYYYNLGYVYGGPIAYQFMNYVYSNCVKNNIKDIAMVARDGYSFVRVFDLINKSGLNAHYVYAPRLLSHIISLHYNEKNHDQVKSIADYYRANLQNAKKSSDLTESYENDLLFIKQNKTNIKKYSEIKKKEYLRYLEQFNYKSKKFAVVDSATIGYTSQKLFESIYPNKDIVGFYWRLNTNQKSKEFVFDKDGTSLSLLKPYDFIELLFTAPEYPIRDLQNGKPVYKKTDNESEIFRVKIYPCISDGCVAFNQDMKKYFPDTTIDYDIEMVSVWVSLLNSYPTDNDKYYMQKIQYASDIQHNTYTPLFKNWYK